MVAHRQSAVSSLGATLPSPSSPEPLIKPDGLATAVFRDAGTVRRPAAASSPAVLALLRHLEAVGFPGSPRVVDSGYDEDGNEVLTYVEGEFVHPHAWTGRGSGRSGGCCARSTTPRKASGHRRVPSGRHGSSTALQRRQSSATGTQCPGTSWPGMACQSPSSTGNMLARSIARMSSLLPDG